VLEGRARAGLRRRSEARRGHGSRTLCAGTEGEGGGQAGLARLVACASGRGNRGTRGGAAPQSQDRAPNGAAWPCACQLPAGARRHRGLQPEALECGTQSTREVAPASSVGCAGVSGDGEKRSPPNTASVSLGRARIERSARPGAGGETKRAGHGDAHRLSPERLAGCSRAERELGCAAEARRGAGAGAELCARGPRAREGGAQV